MFAFVFGIAVHWINKLNYKHWNSIWIYSSFEGSAEYYFSCLLLQVYFESTLDKKKVIKYL